MALEAPGLMLLPWKLQCINSPLDSTFHEGRGCALFQTISPVSNTGQGPSRCRIGISTRKEFLDRGTHVGMMDRKVVALEPEEWVRWPRESEEG